MIGLTAVIKKNPKIIAKILGIKITDKFDNPETFMHELTLDEIDQITKKLPKSLINVNFNFGFI